MITYFQAILLGLVQGLTELFPISSLGHTVILPSLLGWQIDQHADFFVVFLVATHLATALVLLGFFWRDWMRIIAGFFRSLAKARLPVGDTDARLAWVIVSATVPAGLLGLLFQHKLENLFASPRLAAGVLILNGLLLYAAEILRRRNQRRLHDANAEDAAIARLPFMKSLGVGLMQALALIPGFSRTGASLSGALLVGLDHESAARFAFLLAAPLIFAAATLKLPALLHSGYPVGPVVAGALVSAVAAYFSVTFLTRYFKTKTLTPFAIYCVLAGILSLFLVH